MNNILIISQDEKFTSFVRSIGIGRRQENYLIGDKVTKLMKENNISTEDLIKEIGNSYRANILRIIENQEIPKKQLIDKLIKIFNLEEDYFKEKELENVIVTDNGIIVGNYKTNDRAIEVKKQLDSIIKELMRSNKPIVIEMPKN